ncbi:MAG: dihydrofolate reductase [Candidatus Cloacimonetes bacterium]|nr:dihydrofolate reductase [Candidatus Cloacimonadota bacterium]MCB5286745.1 dihydrofolate reductase [Candidatus Cloacimonadota bacterium]MCK9184434.1 dihydrofolate reductase [Candidatus Cloacimonadota bacterium]MCK9583510.1 dihydrofolate reductase [Candidatus Cloacimonadota bacterium]MDY0229066.1 dihydrofolate reductase [Candidatus Cloacimonadaceae bacterium]
MSLKIIVAMTRGRVIGKDNQMPWQIPEDLAYFKKVTSGHSVIMGRKTFLSIGQALPHRKNIVLSRDPSFTAQDVIVYHSLAQAISAEPDAFIIGGATIFEQALPLVEELYITHIEAEIKGDRKFPEIDWTLWLEQECTELHAASGYKLRFCRYKSKKA